MNDGNQAIDEQEFIILENNSLILVKEGNFLIFPDVLGEPLDGNRIYSGTVRRLLLKVQNKMRYH